MEEKTTFGKFVSRKRKERNLTQRELADQLFVTESAVSKWERGISYPDISLVSSLCDLLQISEHELVTSTEDVSQREMERQAKKFRSLRKTYAVVLYSLYGITLLACFIINIAIQHRLSWFFIVLTSVLTAFSLTSLPLLLKKKNRGLLTFCAFFVSLMLLLAVCCIYVKGNWFGIVFVWLLFAAAVVFLPFFLRDLPLPGKLYEHKTLICFAVDSVLLAACVIYSMWYSGIKENMINTGLPTVAVMVLPAWAFMIVIRYVRINGFFKTAACLFMAGIYSFFINGLLMMIIEHEAFSFAPVDFMVWSGPYIDGNIKVILAVALIGSGIAFCIGGIIKSLDKNKCTFKQ